MRPAAHNDNISQTCSKYGFAKECKWKNSTPQELIPPARSVLFEVFTQYHAIPVLNCFYSAILHTRQYSSLLILLVVVFAPRNQSGFWYNESHHTTPLLHTWTQIVNRSSLCQFGEIRTVSWIAAQTTISKFSTTNFSEMQSLSQMCWFSMFSLKGLVHCSFVRDLGWQACRCGGRCSIFAEDGQVSRNCRYVLHGLV